MPQLEHANRAGSPQKHILTAAVVGEESEGDAGEVEGASCWGSGPGTAGLGGLAKRNEINEEHTTNLLCQTGQCRVETGNVGVFRWGYYRCLDLHQLAARTKTHER